MKTMSKRKALGVATVTLGLVLGLAACGSPEDSGSAAPTPSGPAELTDLVVNYQSIAGFTVFRLAVEDGIFEKNGLDVELFAGGPDASALPLLINGEVDVVLGGAGTPILARSEGLPVVIVSGVFTDHEDELGPQYGTVAGADSGIESFADLEGKTVGIHTVNCCWQQYTEDSIAADGGDPSKVEFIQIPFPNQLQALRAGQVDAITTNQPILATGTAEGAVYLGPSMAIALDTEHGIGSVATMSEAFVQANPGVVEAWQRSLAEASEYANANPERMRELIVQETGIDAAAVDLMPLPNWTAALDRDTFDGLTEFMVKHDVLSSDVLPATDDLLASGATG